MGGGDFKQIGASFKQHFIALGGLQPSDRVLDVGCGIGRMAVPLTNYLADGGEYRGFDVVRVGVEWCQKHISPRFSNFQFHHANIHNKHYNESGNCQASEYSFPFSDSTFDFVFLTSVFTHMLHNDINNFLSEIARVTKPGGRLFVTWFLLNEESIYLLDQGLNTVDFQYTVNGIPPDECRTTNEDDPEEAIAFSEQFVRKLISRHGFRVKEPIHFGNWCGRKESVSYQDITEVRRVALCCSVIPASGQSVNR